MESFTRDIENLIALMHEGDYWDFKKQWYADIIELLHDIICMANGQTYGDKYIIIGVDESKKYKICGVKKNDTNRKDTAKLNDFLRSKNFVGDIRPLVRVENVYVENKVLDVIVIEDSNNVPFVLAEDYSLKSEPKKYLRQGNIYTRIGDTNTPLNKTADNDKVENLWRRRFRIFATPLEKFSYYLQDANNWEKTAIDKENGNEIVTSYYYKFAPEYTLNFIYEDEPSGLSDFLCKMWPEASSYDRIHLKVYESVVKEIGYADIDGFRYKSVMPNYFSIAIDRTDRQYLFMTYLVKDELSSLLRNFMFKKENWTGTRDYDIAWLEHVIIFNSEKEKDDFVLYVMQNGQKFLDASNKIECPFEVTERWTDGDSKDWRDTKILRNAYLDWKNSQ